MASNEVLKALEALRKELDKLEPAIKHVETAQQVTETVKNIPQKHIDLINEVKESDYSLTPGRYVGVTFVEDDGVDYKGRLLEIQTELDNLNIEAIELASAISKNIDNIL